MGSLNKIHVVAVPLPAQGHMSPMMHLCKRIAAEEGFTVSFVNVDSLNEQMVQHWVAPKGMDIRLVSVPFSWKMPNGFDAYCLSNLGRLFEDFADFLPPALEELIQQLSREIAPVRCIISDYFLPWTQDVANSLGIPRVILWSGTAAWATLEYHVPQLLAGNHILPNPTKGIELPDENTVIDFVRGITPLRQADIPDYLQGKDELWAKHTVKRSPYVREASWVLVNSFYDLEKDTFDFMKGELGDKFVPVGPIFLLDETETGPTNVVLRSESRECIQWLDKQEPNSVLYISFGSIAVLTVEQFEELAQALEECKHPFLWVIRSELVTGGASEESYKGFCKRTKNQGFIVSWAPQLSVLAHPSIGAFLTHCGWNSMLESICNGVPMLGWPYGAEQNSNCKFMVQDWKIGAGFVKGSNGLIEKKEIARVIKNVMEEDEGKQMKMAVTKLKDKGRKAVEQGALSRKNLEAFLEELRS